VTPSLTGKASSSASDGNPCDAAMMSELDVGLSRATEPLLARVSRTASVTTSRSASCASSDECNVLLTS